MRFGFRLRQELKMLTQHVLLPFAYRVGCLRRCRRRLVVFADAHHRQRPASMDRLFHALADDPKRWRIVEWYRDFGQMGALSQLLASLSFMWLYASAGTVILCDNFLPASSCTKRRETAVIQLWHGPGAFKKFGYDAEEDIPPFYRGHVYRNYDLVTVSGPACVEPFQGAMRLPEGVVRSTGISRMDDCLSDAYREDCRREFARKYPEAAGKKVLLWAPTFRGNAGDPSVPGVGEMETLGRQLGEDWFVVMSLHPHLRRKLQDDRYFGRMPSERILPAADLFVTDYSSLFYDACLQRCRILMFAPDLQEFMEKRGTYLDLKEFPGEIVTESSGLPAAVERTMEHYDFTRQERFAEAYLGACDGHATERIAAFMRHWHRRKVSGRLRAEGTK